MFFCLLIHFTVQPMVGGLEQFGERVLNDLWQAVLEEVPMQSSMLWKLTLMAYPLQFPEEDVELDPLAQARAYHESFIESHARSFVGRSKILQEIRNYVESVLLLPFLVTLVLLPIHSCQDVPSLFAVLGEPGGGKSSLVAAFAREYMLKSKENGDVVIPHFVGAAPGSTNLRHVLERLCSELKLVIASSTVRSKHSSSPSIEGDDKGFPYSNKASCVVTDLLNIFSGEKIEAGRTVKRLKKKRASPRTLQR